MEVNVGAVTLSMPERIRSVFIATWKVTAAAEGLACGWGLFHLGICFI